MSNALDTAIRTLLLPVKPGTGDEYGLRAAEIMNDLGVQEDMVDWVDLEASNWERTSQPSDAFRSFIERLLFSPGLAPSTFIIEPAALGDPATSERILQSFASSYFDLHARVVDEEKVSHQDAKRVLSHTHTMLLLASGARMTASRIYSILLADGIQLGKSWSTPRFILDACKLKQEAPAAMIQSIFDSDAEAEPELLGDLDIEGCVSFVGATGESFGYTGDLTGQLGNLIIEEPHAPYLTMLHFQISLLALFNHRLTNGYEFSPRGEGVLWLRDRYNEAGLNVGLSPFLNNAKSVDTLNAGWASAKKKKERNSARSLTDILSGLDRMSDPSRSALGQYLRAVLHRIVRTSREAGGALAHQIPAFDSASSEALLRGVSLGNTGTRGVVEQRLTDSIAILEAGDLKNWRLRGFGDSVFTTNTSQKKLGDAELKHAEEMWITAIEAHGGRLTERYVQDHLFTMNNVIPLRVEELEDRGPLADWTLDLQFFAHDFELGMTNATNIAGLPVTIRYRKYSELVALASDDLAEVLDQRFSVHLNQFIVHPSTREKVLELITP
ncbi:hypothetical protein SAMN05216376_1322 [Mameliella alba]|nr:hypothetical protein [Mameliella alba]OWV39864.1 hypothetical protein CDZ96_26240 [Mameliella alba]PTR32758.1 hypothetical protein LX94_05181 [Mameliella alba]SDE36284.1 hypothetical protein SAMN05216376_1322 [Mameliella alba]